MVASVPPKMISGMIRPLQMKIMPPIAALHFALMREWLSYDQDGA